MIEFREALVFKMKPFFILNMLILDLFSQIEAIDWWFVFMAVVVRRYGGFGHMYTLSIIACTLCLLTTMHEQFWRGQCYFVFALSNLIWDVHRC